MTTSVAVTSLWKPEFPELADDESLSRKVGAAPAEKFVKITHAVPMLSLGNIFSDDELVEFVARKALPRAPGRGPARFYRRTEDRRVVLQSAL
jgi:NAD-dependent DNA ligase